MPRVAASRLRCYCWAPCSIAGYSAAKYGKMYIDEGQPDRRWQDEQTNPRLSPSFSLCVVWNWCRLPGVVAGETRRNTRRRIIMSDNGPNTGPDQSNAASVPVPSDNQIAYTFKRLCLPAATSGMTMPGHQAADPRAIQAEASARWQAAKQAAPAKSDAQYRADTRTTQEQHPTPRATYRPAPKRGR